MGLNTKIHEVSGHSDHVKEARAGWLAVVGGIMAGPWPEGPSEKPFKPKHDLPKLGNYKRGNEGILGDIPEEGGGAC